MPVSDTKNYPKELEFEACPSELADITKTLANVNELQEEEFLDALNTSFSAQTYSSSPLINDNVLPG